MNKLEVTYSIDRGTKVLMNGLDVSSCATKVMFVHDFGVNGGGAKVILEMIPGEVKIIK